MKIFNIIKKGNHSTIKYQIDRVFIKSFRSERRTKILSLLIFGRHKNLVDTMILFIKTLSLKIGSKIFAFVEIVNSFCRFFRIIGQTK